MVKELSNDVDHEFFFLRTLLLLTQSRGREKERVTALECDSAGTASMVIVIVMSKLLLLVWSRHFIHSLETT